MTKLAQSDRLTFVGPAVKTADSAAHAETVCPGLTGPPALFGFTRQPDMVGRIRAVIPGGA